MAVGLGDDGNQLLDDGVGGQLLLGAERTDPHAGRTIGMSGDGIQAGNALQADDVLRLDQPLLHLNDQGRAAGHYPGVLAVGVQELEDLFQAGGAVELEVYHRLASCVGPMALTMDSRIL